MTFAYRCVFLIAFILVYSTQAFSQSRIWEREIGYSYGTAAQGAVTSDGGAVVVVQESDLRTATVIRTNADAGKLWTREFRDATITVAAAGQDVYVIQDGNSGRTVSLFDIKGVEAWHKPITFSGQDVQALISSATRPDGSVLIATVRGVIAFSKTGVKQFETPAPPASYNDFALQGSADSGFFAFSRDTIYRYDSHGVFLWKRVPPRDPSDPSGVIGMAYATHDTGLVIATSDNFSHELIISKLASDASVSWRKIIGPSGFYGIAVGIGTVEFCEGPKATLEVLFAATTGTGGPDLQQHLYTLRLSATGQTEEMHSIMSSPQSAGWFLAGYAPASDSDFSAVWSDHGNETVTVSLARLAKVPVNDRRWVYSIDGEPVFTFDAGTRWSERAAPRKQDQPLRHQISVRNDTVKINNYLTFVGDIKIDSSDQVNLSGHGRFFVPSFILRIGALNRIDTLRDIQIYQGDFSFGLGAASITQFVNAHLPDKFFGCTIAIDSLRILGGLDAYGVSVAGHFSLPNAIPFTDSTSRIAIDQLVLTKDSVHWRGHISDLQLTKDWKLKNISGSYDNYNDSLALACSLSLPMFKDVTAKASIKGGRLAYAATAVDAKTPIPIGLAGLTVEKFSADIKGLDAPPLNALLKASLATTPDNLMLLDLTGQYVGGTGIACRGDMKLYFVAGAWQAQAKLGGSFYFNSHVQIAGNLDLVNLGSGYLISGQAGLDYVKQPKEQLAGSIDATFTLPKLPGEKDNPNIRWFNDIAGLPFTFAHANVLVKDTICRVALGADLGIANVSITIDPRKQWGDTNLIRVNAKFKELPHARAQQKGSGVPLAVAMDSTRVNEALGKLIVEVAPASGDVPSTTLIDPSGKQYTTTSKPDVIYSEASDKHNAFWTIVNPKLGTWKITSQQDLPVGSITFYGTAVDSAFDLDAAQSGNTLTVTPSGSSWSSRTDFYLDTNGAGYDGILIGSTAGAAPLLVTLPNTLPACSYHVYAIRTGNDDGQSDEFQMAYAPEIITIDKSDLPAPTDVAATISASGHVRVQWRSVGTTVVSYALHLIDGRGSDSIYASVDGSSNSVEFDALPGQTYTALVQPFDSNGVAGCSSEAAPVVLAVKPVAMAEVHETPVVYPNPVTERAMLTFTLASRSSEEIWLLNTLGEVLFVMPRTIYEPGTYEVPLEMSALPAGTYYARISGDRTMTVAISKH